MSSFTLAGSEQSASDSSRNRESNYALTYLPAIDGLRGLAVLLVVWYHTPFLFTHVTALHEGALWRMSTAGWIGVDLFFVVSGFLITSILLRITEIEGSLLVFWYRRGLRILPLAMLYLSILYLNTALHDPIGILNNFDAWVPYFFYMGNLHIAINGWQPIVVMILWSLAVEEQFYILWPALVHYLTRRKLLTFSGMIIALSPLARHFIDQTAGYPAVYVLTICRLDALAAGAVLAVLISSDAWKELTTFWCRKLAPLALAVFLLTFVVPFSPSFPNTRPSYFTMFGYTWISIALAILVGASVTCSGWVRSVLGSRILIFVGKRCYGFYLWHSLVAAVVKKLVTALSFHIGFYGLIAIWLICLPVVVSISWYIFERPILNLKRLCSYPNRKKLPFLPGTQLARINS